jgi:hypothetical protein
MRGKLTLAALRVNDEPEQVGILVLMIGESVLVVFGMVTMSHKL